MPSTLGGFFYHHRPFRQIKAGIVQTVSGFGVRKSDFESVNDSETMRLWLLFTPTLRSPVRIRFLVTSRSSPEVGQRGIVLEILVS
jgi:hypothetical protein